jgi:hypothetical protein
MRKKNGCTTSSTASSNGCSPVHVFFVSVVQRQKKHAMGMPRVTIMLDLVVNKDCLTNEKAILDAIKPCL